MNLPNEKPYQLKSRGAYRLWRFWATDGKRLYPLYERFSSEEVIVHSGSLIPSPNLSPDQNDWHSDAVCISSNYDSSMWSPTGFNGHAKLSRALCTPDETDRYFHSQDYYNSWSSRRVILGSFIAFGRVKLYEHGARSQFAIPEFSVIPNSFPDAESWKGLVPPKQFLGYLTLDEAEQLPSGWVEGLELPRHRLKNYDVTS